MNSMENMHTDVGAGGRGGIEEHSEKFSPCILRSRMFQRHVRSCSPKKIKKVSTQYEETILLTTRQTRQSVNDGRNYTMKLALRKIVSSMYHKPTDRNSLARVCWLFICSRYVNVMPQLVTWLHHLVTRGNKKNNLVAAPWLPGNIKIPSNTKVSLSIIESTRWHFQCVRVNCMSWIKARRLQNGTDISEETATNVYKYLIIISDCFFPPSLPRWTRIIIAFIHDFTSVFGRFIVVFVSSAFKLVIWLGPSLLLVICTGPLDAAFFISLGVLTTF